MRNPKQAFTLMKVKILLAIFLTIILASCGVSSEEKTQQTTLLVSLPPHKALVEKIVDEDFIVQTIVPIGSNPHVFEPTPRQVSQISKAVLWFQIGESFEKKIFPVLKQKNAQLIIQDLKQDLPLLHGCGCHCHDPEILEDKHIWTSPKLLKMQAATIEKILSEKFPQKAEIFSKNTQILMQELDTLDAKVKTLLKDVENRSIIVSHPAFAYFCKDYNIEQISVEFEGKEPTIGHINTILEKITKQKTHVAIGMPQHSNKGLEIIAKKNHLHLCLIDPYDENFENTISLLAEQISQ